MEITINPLSDVLHEAEIIVTEAELQPHFDAAYGKEQKRLEIKGFRKGKAPLAIIKQLYGQAIEHQALDSVANDFYRKAMDEKDIRPLGEPSMVDMDYRRGESFRFKIQYEIRPEIALGNYKKLKVEKPVHTVNDDEIEAEILRVRKSNSTTEEVAEVTDMEHIVTADIQELDPAGTPIIGRKAKDMRFYLADETLSNEIRNALKNAAVGSSYRSRLEAAEGEGKSPLEVSLNVTKVEKVFLPAFDEALVSKVTGGKVSSVDEFRTNLRGDLERYWADWSEHKLADAISAEIVKAHEFPVPESLVNTVMDSYIEDIKTRSRDRKLPKDFDETKFRHDSRELAVWQAKWLLLKERIAEVEGITAGEEDLAKAAAEEATRIGLPADRLLEYYRKSSSAKSQLLSRKIMSFLVAEAAVTEREVTHEHEPEHQH
jgi:trigger factor